MRDEAISWGKTGRVRLVPGARYRHTWTDVVVDDYHVASVWFEKGIGWRAGMHDRFVGRMPATQHATREDAVLWVLWARHHDVWSEEVQSGVRSPE